MKTILTSLFHSGQILSTPGAIEALKAEGLDASTLLQRHFSGDWGDLCKEDKAENDYALTRALRLFSAYLLPRTGVKLWIITEADRSATTLLLPDEY
jgi:hypothetical protein